MNISKIKSIVNTDDAGSSRPDSNRRPTHYECVALPTEPRKHVFRKYVLKKEIEATGFEPAASASLTQRSTKLSHASIYLMVSSVFCRPSSYFKRCSQKCKAQFSDFLHFLFIRQLCDGPILMLYADVIKMSP